jgi:hypothetical protein
MVPPAAQGDAPRPAPGLKEVARNVQSSPRLSGATPARFDDLQPSHPYRPCAELLEGRTLLAGNVITTPPGTPDSPGEPAPVLLVKGDSANNEIMVKKGNAPTRSSSTA